jgi:hypothetical protein
MNKISFIMSGYYSGNKIFDLENNLINRDNCAYPYFLLKKKFLDRDYDLSTVDINPINDSVALIYNDAPRLYHDYSMKDKSFLLAFESELIIKNNFDKSIHEIFNKIFTWSDDLIDNEKYIKFNFSHLLVNDISLSLQNKNKFCCIIAGNKNANDPRELYSKRIEAIRFFEQNYSSDFDLYGTGWDLYLYLGNKVVNSADLKKPLFAPIFPSYKGKVESKKDTLSNYKFSICYENAKDIPGYITEKIFDCFFAGCVPVYWGANNVGDHIPSSCFIDKRDFSTYEELYLFLATMKDSVYLEYLNSIKNFLSSGKASAFDANYVTDNIVNTILKDIES